MSADNVSTASPLRKAVGKKAVAANPAPEPVKPELIPHPGEEGVEGRRAIRERMERIPNAPAVVQAITGKSDVTGERAADVIQRALHGDGYSAGTRTSNELRTGTHVGARDAKIAELETRRERLTGAGRTGKGEVDQSPELRRVELQLKNERGLNAVTDTLHVLGADASKVDLLENRDRVRVVADDQLSGSAGYDEATDSVLISQSLATEASKLAASLERQGILDKNGRIIRGKEADLDLSTRADELIKIGTLIAYHETTHEVQHDLGKLDSFVDGARTAVRDGLTKHNELQQGAEWELPEWSTSDAAWEVETKRIDTEEYDAYLAQEQADVALGANVKIHLVTNIDGTPIDRAQGVDNIVDMTRGRALRHGPDAGWVRSDVMREILENAGVEHGITSDAGPGRDAVPWSPHEVARTGSTILSETPGWKRPGWKRPGWKRPGSIVE